MGFGRKTVRLRASLILLCLVYLFVCRKTETAAMRLALIAVTQWSTERRKAWWERLDPVRAIKLRFRLSHRTSAGCMMTERRNDPLQVSLLTQGLAMLKLI